MLHSRCNETVSEGLDAAGQEVGALEQQASQAKTELEEAQQEVARARSEAEGQVQELQADLVEAEARAKSAATCAQAAVAAFGSISTPRAWSRDSTAP